MVKKLPPSEALEVLPYTGKRAALPLAKVIKSAMANALQKGADEKSLVFKEIQVGEGPILKRGRPVSRGRWHPIQKKMSHIRVVLETKVAQDTKVEKQKSELTLKSKKGGR